MSLSYAPVFTEPWYEGTGTGALVPGRFHAALNGRPYMLDLATNNFEIKSVPLIREQSDAGPVSEQSINPEDLWRRGQETWHKGAGQSVLDRADSDPARFDTSKGVNVWNRWQLTLLNTVTQRRTAAFPNVQCIVVDNYLYIAAGATVVFTTSDLTAGAGSFTSVTGGPSAAVQGFTSDGSYIYATGGGTIYRAYKGTTTFTAWNTVDTQILSYVKGRLMATHFDQIYNVIDTTVPDPMVVASSLPGDFRWVGFVEGETCIYAAGYVGDKSHIFRTSVKTDGSALDVLLPAGSLPDGEIIHAIVGYLGFVLIGTSLGVRFATADTEGNLTLGNLIPTSNPVLCFEPQDRYVWFGLTDFDYQTTGLGRVDLSTFTDINTPAYASDILAAAQGNVTSVATYRGTRVFTVADSGLWAEQATPETVGTLSSGRITYRLPDQKVACQVDVAKGDDGRVEVFLSTEGGPFRDLGSHTTETDPFPTGYPRGVDFEVKLSLTPVASVSPTVKSFTLRSYPAATTIEMVTAPLLFHETVTDLNGASYPMDVQAEMEEIRSLAASRAFVSWQVGDRSCTAVLQDYVWTPHHATLDSSGRRGWNGTCTVQLKCLTGM